MSLLRDFLTECSESGPEQRAAPAILVGQRSVYEIIATSDLVDLAGVLFAPGVLPAFVADRADLLSNRIVPLDQLWSGFADTLRCRMLRVPSRRSGFVFWSIAWRRFSIRKMDTAPSHFIPR